MVEPFDVKSLKGSLVERMFGRVVENRWRGDLVEEIVVKALAPIGWTHCSADWSSWDLQHDESRLKMQVKQTARQQTWGVTTDNRYGIAPATGFYERNVWKKLPCPQRLSEVYLFAHHPIEGEAADHWNARQWKFSVVAERELPNAKSISSAHVTDRWKPVDIDKLQDKVNEVRVVVAPNGRVETAGVVARPPLDDSEPGGVPS